MINVRHRLTLVSCAASMMILVSCAREGVPSLASHVVHLQRTDGKRCPCDSASPVEQIADGSYVFVLDRRTFDEVTRASILMFEGHRHNAPASEAIWRTTDVAIDKDDRLGVTVPSEFLRVGETYAFVLRRQMGGQEDHVAEFVFSLVEHQEEGR